MCTLNVYVCVMRRCAPGWRESPAGCTPGRLGGQILCSFSHCVYIFESFCHYCMLVIQEQQWQNPSFLCCLNLPARFVMVNSCPCNGIKQRKSPLWLGLKEACVTHGCSSPDPGEWAVEVIFLALKQKNTVEWVYTHIHTHTHTESKFYSPPFLLY